MPNSCSLSRTKKSQPLSVIVIKKLPFIVGVLNLTACISSQNSPESSETLERKPSSQSTSLVSSPKTEPKRQLNLTAMDNFDPLFGKFQPLDPTRVFFLSGHEEILLQEMQFSELEASKREADILRLEKEIKELPLDSPQQMQLGTQLLQLYKMQAAYLDVLGASGKKDPKYPNLLHFIKVTQSMVALHAERLIKQFPSATTTRDWKTDLYVSKLKSFDLFHWKETREFIKNEKGPGVERLKTVALLVDEIRNKQAESKLGISLTLSDVNQVPMDNLNKSIRLLLLARTNGKEPYEKTSSLLVDSARLSRNLVAISPEKNPIFISAMQLFIQSTLTQRPDDIDNKLSEMLVFFKLSDHHRIYLENIALNLRKSNPEKSIKTYDILKKMNLINQTESLKLEARKLDIALAAGKTGFLLEQWSNFSQLKNDLVPVSIEIRRTASMNLMLASWSRQGKTFAPNALALHDHFTNTYSDYQNHLEWELKTYQRLMEQKEFQVLSDRSQKRLQMEVTDEKKIQVISFAIESQINLLNIPPGPLKFDDLQLSHNETTIAQNAANLLDQQAKLLPLEPAKQKAKLERLYFLGLANKYDEAISLYKELSSTQALQPEMSQPASFLLNKFKSDNLIDFREAALRATLEANITPSLSEHRSLKNLLESTLYTAAMLFLNNKKHESAFRKFTEFQDEFPGSSKSSTALHLASLAALQIPAKDKALQVLEHLITNYPKSEYAKESRWQCAKLSEEIGQYERGGDHLMEFQKDFPGPANAKKALFLAGKLYQKASQDQKAIQAFLAASSQSGDALQKIESLQEAFLLQKQRSMWTESLTTLDQVQQIGAGIGAEKTDDIALWAKLKEIEIKIASQNQGEAEQKARKFIALEFTTPKGQQYISKGKFLVAKMDAQALRKKLGEPNLQPLVNSIYSDYKKAVELYLNVCEVPSVNWCSAAYYESGQLAQELASALTKLSSEMARAENNQQAEQITPETMTSQKLMALVHDLSLDTKAYAGRAVTALTINGTPNAIYHKKIKELESQLAKSETPFESLTSDIEQAEAIAN
jgi:TolA-binding protein